MSRTQKNKATNYHLGTLKAKIEKIRSELLIEQSGGSGSGGGEGFDVARLGDARVALIGFPSVGKSTLLSTLTETKSEVAAVSYFILNK
jgi:ribosome-interacting GTPase 1